MSMNISNENEGLELLLGRVKQYLGSNKDVDVAKALGIGTSTISTWRKRHSYSNDVFIEFAFVKNISLEWLFRGAPPMMCDDMDMYDEDMGDHLIVSETKLEYLVCQTKTLESAIEYVEVCVSEIGKTITAAKKAKIIRMVNDELNEKKQMPAKKDIVDLIELAST
ncbi:MAG: helix-turn-helix domain-containing protein [Methylophaga sp.]|nr:helix-turn-helix domain-containing protein [Methylophaga sp.]